MVCEWPVSRVPDGGLFAGSWDLVLPWDPPTTSLSKMISGGGIGEIEGAPVVHKAQRMEPGFNNFR